MAERHEVFVPPSATPASDACASLVDALYEAQKGRAIVVAVVVFDIEASTVECVAGSTARHRTTERHIEKALQVSLASMNEGREAYRNAVHKVRGRSN